MESLVNGLNLEHFYKGKKVLVTGHTGFKGAWLITWLNLLGAEIKGYALHQFSEESIYHTVAPHIPHESIIADIRDRQKLTNEIAKFQPDYIFHLAAQSLVRRSYAIPSETFDVNVTGTANLLESLLDLKKKCTVLVITTDKVYENLEQDMPYKETDRLGGHDPYSASKACSEIVVQSFSKSFFDLERSKEFRKSIASARAGNVIGGGDWNQDRIIPDIIKHLRNGTQIPIRNPHSIRPWQHVLEPLGGYLLLGGLLDKNPTIPRSINFGPELDDHLEVKKLVEMAISNWQSGSWSNISDANEPHEAGILKLDIRIAKNQLGWFPKLNCSQAIQWTIEWYRQNRSSLFDFTLQQIINYQLL